MIYAKTGFWIHRSERHIVSCLVVANTFSSGVAGATGQAKVRISEDFWRVKDTRSSNEPITSLQTNTWTGRPAGEGDGHDH
ncbi:hypothetical protein GALMADRAFT_245109 [Galerina marginata CBS 339.88]|uniref:Uncharacterized protein n=1 Tax=Galerina marginata (strain CBS 339.88) TaxID=685588 RepID=A0A067TGJ5_GALM3|nr:hypothetical protein GALMADRAFT_245109 [Galerina marginata CBS 339.88]